MAAEDLSPFFDLATVRDARAFVEGTDSGYLRHMLETVLLEARTVAAYARTDPAWIPHLPTLPELGDELWTTEGQVMWLQEPYEILKLAVKEDKLTYEVLARFWAKLVGLRRPRSENEEGQPVLGPGAARRLNSYILKLEGMVRCELCLYFQPRALLFRHNRQI